jgi:hypothetical protein
MTKPVFELSIGYTNFLVSAADAAKVMEILADARTITRSWFTEGVMIHDADKPEVSLKLFSGAIASDAEYRVARDGAAAEYEARRSAKALEDAQAA